MDSFIELLELNETLLEVMMSESANEVRSLELLTFDLDLLAWFALVRTDVDIIEVEHSFKPDSDVLDL